MQISLAGPNFKPRYCAQIPGEKIYEEWDCPKVEAVESHRPLQNDEIPLLKGETANVLKKTSDGQTEAAADTNNQTDINDNNLEDECSRL